jgi:hypothetical protein
MKHTPIRPEDVIAQGIVDHRGKNGQPQAAGNPYDGQNESADDSDGRCVDVDYVGSPRSRRFFGVMSAGIDRVQT